MKKSFGFLVLVLTCALVLTACGGANYTTDLKITLNDFSFTPKDNTIPAGQEITLSARNDGKVVHEFVIIKKGEKVSAPFNDDDQPKIYWEIEVKPGNTETVKFTAPAEPGEYQLVCGIQGHVEAGMLGILTVVQP